MDPVMTLDPVPERVTIVVHRTRGDRFYRGLATGAGIATLALMGLIGLFLLLRALPALRQAGFSFLTETLWETDAGRFGIAAVMFGTFVIAAIALVIAVPVAVASALFISEYAPRRVAVAATSLIDLLAAVPSLIYGLWGFFFLQPVLIGISQWLTDHLGFVPIFHTERRDFSSSAFIAGVVVALMIVPIAASVIRQVFSLAPQSEREGAFALGATRWGMIRTVVLPFGRGGIIGGSMLGLGRALGETIAVAIIISPAFIISERILEGGGNSVASLIALRFGESDEIGISALMAAGLALFVVTLLVNLVSSAVIARSRSGAGVEA